MSGQLPTSAVSGALPWLAAALFLLALTVVELRRRRRTQPHPLDHLPSGLGVLALLGHLGLRAHELGRLPVGNLRESCVFLAFLLALAHVLYLIATRRRHYPAVELLLLGVVLAFLGLSFLVPAAALPSAPAATLANRWFLLHVMLSFLGATALFGSCVVSILYLLADVQLKSKRPGWVLRIVPSLVACDRAAMRLLLFGFSFLSLGIVAGWLWGRETGRQLWEAKEIWALVAWTIYAALLFARVQRGWRGRRAAILAVTGAVAVLVAVLGIRF